MPTALTRLNQLSEIQASIARHHNTRRRRAERASEPVWNVRLGKHQCLARDSHHAFIGSAASRGRQRSDQIGYVRADDGEIAAVEFPNIRATLTCVGARPAGVRVRADSAEKVAHNSFSSFVAFYVCYESVANIFAPARIVKLEFASMARKKTPANVVGKQVQKRRYELALTQEAFAAKCQLHGLDISRGTVSQIEAQIRCVNDEELFLLASALGVSTEALYPPGFKTAKGGRK